MYLFWQKKVLNRPKIRMSNSDKNSFEYCIGSAMMLSSAGYFGWKILDITVGKT